MRAWLCSICLVLAVSANAQQDSIRTGRSRWRIGATASLDRCYRTLSATEEDAYLPSLIALRDEREKPLIRCSPTLYAMRDVGRHLRLSAGVAYFTEGYYTEDDGPWIAIDPVASDPAISDVTFRTFSIFRYLALPIMVTYEIGGGPWKPFGALGVAPELLLEARYVTELEQFANTRRKENTVDGYRNVGLTACGQLGIGHAVSERFVLSLAATGRYGVLDIIDAPITARLWSVGGQLGISYRL
ncbi:MAG TPA: hypothetical protein VHL57_04815 [Flavobacteriales bacterium]|jgi:hypothetical protein|nr:hypothetical protein [Flavobacteriales bacterium]